MFKKILFAVLFLSLVISSSSAEEYAEGDVIVVLRPSAKGEITASSLSVEASDFAGQFSASVKEFYPSLSELGGGAFMMLHSDELDAENFSSMLRENPSVLAASPNYKVHAAVVPDDNGFGDCWGMSYINAPSAWDRSTGSEKIYVAVIDSGIDHTNPDLTANVDTSLSFRSIAGDSTDGKDDYGHGTHVAGTIGAVGNNGIGVAGLNWNVKLISVKALDSSGSGYISTVISGMNYVTELINNGVNIRAVNLSLETYLALEPTHDNLVSLALWRAFKILDDTNKALIVVAAGNQGETVGEPSSYAHGKVPGANYYAYPASFKGLDNMISVSALAQVPLLGTGYVDFYSNNGATLSAPGTGIVSTWLQSSTSSIGDDGVSLRRSQGTSMAAPHVAGSAALIASVLPENATAYQIKQALVMNRGLDAELDAAASMSYALSNFSNLSERGTEGRAYDDYADYSTQEYKSTGGGGGSSSGCSGFSCASACVAFVILLARKNNS